MSNTIKKCKNCKGTGQAPSRKLDDRNTLKECQDCQGTGVPLFDEEFDNALSFLQKENDDLDDED